MLLQHKITIQKKQDDNVSYWNQVLQNNTFKTLFICVDNAFNLETMTQQNLQFASQWHSELYLQSKFLATAGEDGKAIQQAPK